MKCILIDGLYKQENVIRCALINDPKDKFVESTFLCSPQLSFKQEFYKEVINAIDKCTLRTIPIEFVNEEDFEGSSPGGFYVQESINDLRDYPASTKLVLLVRVNETYSMFTMISPRQIGWTVEIPGDKFGLGAMSQDIPLAWLIYSHDCHPLRVDFAGYVDKGFCYNLTVLNPRVSKPRTPPVNNKYRKSHRPVIYQTDLYNSLQYMKERYHWLYSK